MRLNKPAELQRRIREDLYKTPIGHVMDIYGYDKAKAYVFYTTVVKPLRRR